MYEESRLISCKLKGTGDFMKHIKDYMNNGIKERTRFIKVPYGYRIEGNRLVVEEKEALRIRYALKYVMEYLENPPECLVLELMKYKENTQNIILEYEEATKKIPYGWICQQVGEEMELREKCFQAGKDSSLAALKGVFELPLLEVKWLCGNGKIQNMKQGGEEWEQRLLKIPVSDIYTGIMTVRKRSSLEEERHEGYFEPIISKEQFDALNKWILKNQSDITRKRKPKP